MNRRKVIKSIGIFAGSTILASDIFLSSCSFLDKQKEISTLDQEVSLIEDIAETILPRTKNSPGAKDAKVGKLISRIVNDFYNPVEQKVFLEGLILFKQDDFHTMSPKLKEAYLLNFKKTITHKNSSVSTTKLKGELDYNLFFSMIKQLSIWAYLCAEIVATEAFNYIPIPGRYSPCIEVGDKIKPMYWNPDSKEILRGLIN